MTQRFPHGPRVFLGGLALVALLGAIPPEEDPGIAIAAMEGAGREAVVELIRQGGDVNAAQGDGMTALHWAAVHGDEGLADLLLSAGARLEPTTRLGRYTPLHLASMEGNGGVVAVLLAAGADPAARTASGNATALHLAATAGSEEAVRALLDHGAEVDAEESIRDQTPLMFAAARGRDAVIRVLLQHGADPARVSAVADVRQLEQEDRRARMVRDSILKTFRPSEVGDGELWIPTPSQVQAAARAARTFLRDGAPEFPAPPEGPAVSQESVEFEPEAGVPVEDGATEESRGGEVPGEEPRPDEAPRDEPPAVETEEDTYDPGWTARIGTRGGMSPLLYAARDGHVKTAIALLEGGADVDQVGGGDQTSPLLMATINGHYDLAMELLARGADPNLSNASGDSPLYAAIETRWAPRVMMPQQHAWMNQETTHVELVAALLEAGADPNPRLSSHLWYMQFNRGDLQVDTRGATPFWRATHALDLEVMKLLVAYGADPGVPTRRPPVRGGGYGGGGDREDASGLPPVPVGGPGVFPIHAASGVGHGQGFAANVHRYVPDGWLPAVRYLVEELGADVNARDHDGYSPVHHAAARGDNELIRFLVEHGADVTLVSRRGQTTVDMANGPIERIQPFPRTIELLEGLGAMNNHNCVSC